jgi:hypothetical protein
MSSEVLTLLFRNRYLKPPIAYAFITKKSAMEANRNGTVFCTPLTFSPDNRTSSCRFQAVAGLILEGDQGAALLRPCILEPGA